ncbi:hypothetical protein M885DRAFT_570832 [Pelagophyceae sp. CCMP2097]|nr:hypothetical protein M885DRAFT_570832 [Pelagophyceae sp. CCMP2097]
MAGHLLTDTDVERGVVDVDGEATFARRIRAARERAARERAAPRSSVRIVTIGADGTEKDQISLLTSNVQIQMRGPARP